MEMDHFIDISPAMKRKHAVLGTAGAAVSLTLCLFVLGASLWIWTHKKARPQLHRVSFKLLLWAMGAQVIYDVIYIILYAPTGLIKPDVHGCGAGVLFRLAAIGTVNYLCTCIAINLMLTITFGVNPVERRLLRYYVGSSIFLGIIIPTIPACMHHFGWDPVFEYCYFTGSEKNERVRHLLLDLYLWQAVSCLIATIAVAVTLITIFKSSRANRPLEDEFEDLNNDPSLSRMPTSTETYVRPAAVSRFSFKRRKVSAFCLENAPDPSNLTMYQLRDKFLSIALRISLYPIALIIVNTILTFGDMYTAVHGTIPFKSTWAFLCFHAFLYGGRGIFFALLCIFVDPCLTRGFRAVLNEKRATRGKKQSPKSDDTQSAGSISEQSSNEKSDISPQHPVVPLPSYSPTFIPPGEERVILEDQLPVPVFKKEKEEEKQDDQLDPTTTLPYQSFVDSSNDFSGSARSRQDSNITMDINTILHFGPAPSAHYQGRKDSTVTMDLSSMLASPPDDFLQRRTNSTATMDIGQALSLPTRFLAGPSGNASTVSLRSELDLQQALSAGPGRNYGRKDSTMTMDITQALGLNHPLPPSASSSGSPSELDAKSMMSENTTLNDLPRSYPRSNPRIARDPRRPSLPRMWKGAFDNDPYTPVNRPGATPRRNQGRVEGTTERKRMEWVRGMEKLYEEAEAQL